jgi:hypothetical protein
MGWIVPQSGLHALWRAAVLFSLAANVAWIGMQAGWWVAWLGLVPWAVAVILPDYVGKAWANRRWGLAAVVAIMTALAAVQSAVAVVGVLSLPFAQATQQAQAGAAVQDLLARRTAEISRSSAAVSGVRDPQIVAAELDLYLASEARNSSGQPAGSVRDRTQDCTRLESYYPRTYCPRRKALEQELTASQAAIEARSAESVVAALEDEIAAARTAPVLPPAGQVYSDLAPVFAPIGIQTGEQARALFIKLIGILAELIVVFGKLIMRFVESPAPSRKRAPRVVDTSSASDEASLIRDRLAEKRRAELEGLAAQQVLAETETARDLAAAKRAEQQRLQAQAHAQANRMKSLR